MGECVVTKTKLHMYIFVLFFALMFYSISRSV